MFFRNCVTLTIDPLTPLS